MPVPIRRVPVWAGALACMVLIGEILLRQPGLLERLPPPERYLWHATNVQPKLDALDALERSRGVDVIFLGNSTVLAGIDPRDFDAARGHGSDARASYNGALQALPAAAVREFAEVFADRARPDAMIYGLTPQDLNRNSPTGRDVTQRVAEAPAMVAATADGPVGWAARKLIAGSQVFRYRFILVELLLRGGHLAPLEPDYFDDRGAALDSRVLADVPETERGAYFNKDGVWAYAVDGVQSDALDALAEFLAAREIRLILVNMPLADDYYANFDAPTDYPAYMARLTDTAARHRLSLWDMEHLPFGEGFDDRHFADFNHLNRDGARRLSRQLAERYAAVSVGPTP